MSVESPEKLRNQLIHAAGFIEGMAARIHRRIDGPLALQLNEAAADMRAYASGLRKLLGIGEKVD